jgi:peptide/nickel transport system substrate-binding protein
MTRLRWAGALALVSLITTACGMGGGDTSNDQSGGSGNGHLVYASQFAPASAWAVETDDAFILTKMGCMETLIRYENDGSLQPGLAESWKQVSPKKWTFTLRSGVEFQDGTPMDAEAVAGALNHVLEAQTPARSFNPDTVSGVEAVDEATVQVTTPAPDVLLPYRMASPNTGILAPKAYAEQRIDIKGTCTGPFTVTGEKARQSVQLERNESYWGDEPQLATAEMRFVVDPGTRVTQLQTGEADIIESFPPSAKVTLEGDDSVQVMELQLPRTTSMLLNASRPPFDDPLVRQALQHAVDTQAIADGIYEGAAVPAIGPFSPDDPWAPEGAEPIALDKAEAERLLSEAGVDPSSMSFELIAYNDRPEFADLAAVIQDELGQLGIDVSIKTGEYASFEPDLLAGNFDAALLSRGYMVDVGDPAGYLTSDFTCDGSYNIAHYCDPETDAMIEKAAATKNTDDRYAQYAEIGELLEAEAAGVFLVHNSAQNAVAADVQGYEIHPLGFYGLTPEVSIG